MISKRGGVWNECIIIGCFHDGEIVVFGKDQSHDYGLLRCFNIRRAYPNSLVLALEYEEKRNILILGTSNGDIIFYDVDKNRATNCIEAKGLEIVKLAINYDIPNVLAFGKNGEVFGVYLPPHSKKFKVACNILAQNSRNE